MKLPVNETPVDRAIRIAIGVVLFALGAAGVVAAPWLYIGWAVGAIMLVTGAVGFCPLYAIFRFSAQHIRR